MRIRHLIACSVAVSLAVATAPAFAATKKPKKPVEVCRLLVDEKGDGRAQTGGAVLQSAALDITGADVASGPTTVVGVLRLATLKTDNDPATIMGATWNLMFTVRGTSYRFQRHRASGTGTTYDYSFTGGVKPTVIESPGKNEVTFTVPRSAIPELKKAKQKFETIAVSSTVFVTNADAGGTDKTYVDRTPSCLHAK
jgi:hypothetical protein